MCNGYAVPSRVHCRATGRDREHTRQQLLEHYNAFSAVPFYLTDNCSQYRRTIDRSVVLENAVLRLSRPSESPHPSVYLLCYLRTELPHIMQYLYDNGWIEGFLENGLVGEVL
ncbi:hypothetical protein ANN_19401 [Periplaneta americana]|uniref:Uncharacterized protein n=1 Tax=Periplaneta americana TaxID=6978 RepID=A0ABQ8SA00_PERAM|nr:hypothetical protein ANN_19401 [Periplaneta americana]